jgi:hypothetical protein
VLKEQHIEEEFIETLVELKYTYHLKKVFSDSELLESSVIRNFRITAADEKTATPSITILLQSSPSAIALVIALAYR